MDPLTHGLTGIVVGNLGFKRKGAFKTLVLASVIPDIDYVSLLFGGEYFLKYHRGITHSFLALFAVSFAVFLLCRSKKDRLYYSMLAFVGYGLHILFDLTNQYGVRLMTPFDPLSYSWDLTFIIDPYVLAGLALSVIMMKMNKDKAKTVAFITIFLCVSYIGVKKYYHDKATEFIRETKIEYVVKRLSPLPNDILTWWFVAESGGDIKVGVADMFTDSIYVNKSYPKQSNDPAIDASRKLGIVKSFLYFTKLPYAEVEREGGRVIVRWSELSNSYRQGEHFVVTIGMDRDGKVLSGDFKL